ncbi:DgyrCDS4102 [Dimorphilus gyrociliatus]|uniref:DgyrCDS4102 n=1 Tax=Dimorphilus gyrociliatus TaxID=2664684 RepID=A0A7I8VFX3_9ANNE|nr:DgyrCDS4102 [Dimorphilus gyrociliatus]
MVSNNSSPSVIKGRGFKNNYTLHPHVQRNNQWTNHRRGRKMFKHRSQYPHKSSGVMEEENKPRKLKTQKTFTKDKDKELTRLRVNFRERERMHDLNMALESLRQILPQPTTSQSGTIKKLSKMATLITARSYILALTRSIEETKRMIEEAQRKKLLSTIYKTSSTPYCCRLLSGHSLPATSTTTTPPNTTTIETSTKGSMQKKKEKHCFCVRCLSGDTCN